MLAQYPVMQYLYTNFSLEKYNTYLDDMIPNNYKQIAVFEGDVCVGLSGLWSGTKLWSGKYLEIDNFIVHPEHRKRNWQNANGLCRCQSQRTRLYHDCFDAYWKLYCARFITIKDTYLKDFILKILNEEGLS
jgi:hypothetical protein